MKIRAWPNVYARIPLGTDHVIYFEPDEFEEFVKMCQVIAEESNK